MATSPAPAPALVLVVDDDAGLARLMARAIAREGFATISAGSGQAALNWLATNTADLMLLDLKLPDMAGKEIVDRLAAAGRPVPFIVVTGQSDERVAVKLMKGGALDYLIKDAQLIALLPAIVRHALDQIEYKRRLEREILEISDRELRRIGSDFHDGLGQELTALELFTASLLAGLHKQAPNLEPRFREMSGQLQRVVREARALAHGLCPVSLAGDGLVTALRELAEGTRRMTKVRCEFAGQAGLAVTDPIVANHLYRIAQEAANNALKHSRAKIIRISLSRQGDALQLTVSDNGRGLDKAAIKGGGIGLQMMKYRADLIHASVEVTSAPKKGTKITCRLRTEG